MSPRYRFSGHETFPFRYPWPLKGVRGLMREPELFFRDDAIVRLGVGKNMVASIRFWLEALGLAVIDGRARSGYPTELGQKLFREGGWDPYLEDPATLWLLHWRLVKTPEIASTWSLVFGSWVRSAFTRTELLDWLEEVAREAGNQRTSRNSLKRDLDVFVRTYAQGRPERCRSPENTFDCPLADLGFIRPLDRELYWFGRDMRSNLPVEVFAYALAQYWKEHADQQQTLSFERVLYGRGAPGAAFKLSDAGLAAHLEALPAWAGFDFDETGGLRLVIRREDARTTDPVTILERYYDRHADEVAA